MDPGAERLDRLLAARARGMADDIGLFLRLAIGITGAVGEVHARGLIHKDIKPANILLDAATARVWLTGFGIASRVRRERQSPEPPGSIAGTLAYMAPEQTGRMNRSIDSRSDLYSLGVTLYEMLTGRLPFTASDPLEWVHCHIARQAAPPADVASHVPTPVSAIVMKLLAKAAEDRYQTAAGVERDLRRCLAAWEAQGRIDDFPLRERDIPDRLLIPEKLYGREREVETLLGAFDDVVRSGAPELVLVSGYSGIGKSAVVSELHKVLVPPRGLFASGKFDQYKRDIPYSTLAQAFQGLIRRLLATSEAELQRWRDALREALGLNGRLMIDLVPELKLVVGEQPQVPDLPPKDAQKRFQLVFRRFISVFARREHPLALFLDDLQWVDAATLDLIEDLLTASDVEHLLLVGAYRDNEVTPADPLLAMLARLRRAAVPVREVVLAPLPRTHLRQFVADALRSLPAQLEELTDLVAEKTSGNPFFAIQFLTSLETDGLVRFDREQVAWQVDVAGARARNYTDNVVALMVTKLQRLSADAQEAAMLAACVGNVFAAETLAVLRRRSEAQIHADLFELVREGLLDRVGASYRFSHDRVQQAAYALIPEDRRSATHLNVGRLLLEHTPESHLAEGLFDIVNHLNLGASLITDAREGMRTAELNLLAGRRAKASAAYEGAARYAQAGIQLLEDGGWAADYRLAYDLHLELAQLEYLLGNRGRSQDLIATVLAHAHDRLDKAAAYEFLVDLYLTEAEIDRAVQTALDCISLFGIELKPHPTRVEVQNEYDALRRSLGDRQIEDLLDLPPMTSAETKAALGALAASMMAAFFTDRNLLLQLSCQMVNLSLRHGNADASALGYVWLGSTLGLVFGKYEEGYRFGKLARDYTQKHGLAMLKPRIDVVFGFSIHSWTKPLRTDLPCLEEGFRSAVELGDLTYACYCAHHIVTLRLVQGSPLDAVYRESEARLDFVRRARYAPIVEEIVAMQRFVQNMRGLTASFSTFDGATFDQRAFEEHLDREVRPVTVSEYYIWKLAARFISGDVAEAIEASERARALLWSTPGPLHAPEYHYYRALSLASAYRDAGRAERRDRLQALREHEAQLREWANHCPENFASKSALVSAEVARIAGDDDEAMRLYERAIRSAAESGLVHNEAIAYELASRFWRARGFAAFADTYLRSARACYQRWGAEGKVRQLEEAHPHLRPEQPPADPRSTMGAPVEHLELATVLKISQAVSGEIVLEKLIDSLMRMAIEHAGAERGLLILPGDHELRIQAEATTGTGSIAVALRNARVSSADLPESVVQYAARTGEIVLLDDASARGAFTADEYVRRKHARSILCLPLVKQGRMVALLYLENDLTAGVFTPARISVLSVLASHAATSLENARLFTERKRAEHELRRSQSYLAEAQRVSHTGSFGWNVSTGEITWSAETYRIFEVAPATPPTIWVVLERTHPDDRSAVETAIRRAEQEGIDFDLEHRLVMPDGSVKHLHVVARAITDEAGRREFAGAVMDVTARKRAEEDLRGSESRFRTLLDFAADAFMIHDDSGAVVDVNRQACENLGHAREELIGMTPADFDAYRDAATLTSVSERVFAGETVTFETRHRRKDGTVFPVEVRVRRVQYGDRFFAISLSRDITERKRAEEEREKLRQAEADLARISRATTMGEFTASLAHEIRQPVAAAITNANACIRWLARDRPDVGEARAAAARIVADATRVAEIVTRVRALYKNDALRRERVDVNDVVRETLALLRSEASRHSVSIQTDLALDLPAAMGDRVQLQQVLVNLILNALEATGAAPGVLRIESARGSEGELLVTVSDEGVGLPEGAADRIFDAFFTTKPQGTGMGLAISRSIVERHGGRVWATPTEPRGTSFHVSLPAADPTE